MITSRARKQHQFKFSWKTASKFTFYIFLFVLLLCATMQLKKAQYFPIRSVKVFGIHHADQRQFQDFLLPYVKNGFFGVDVDVIKERLMQQPWVADAIVQRIWPDHILIKVIEKEPIAKWNDTGLLSRTGQLFNPSVDSYPAGLPQFIGPEGQQIAMGENFDKINNLLIPLHFKISRLELSPTLSWTIVLDNGVKITAGHKDILTRIDHFVKVYPKIVGTRVANVDYVDLRYSNGMAVRWKSIT